MTNSLLARFDQSARATLPLGAYLLAAISQSLKPAVVADVDLWWHLRAGQWIVEHGAVPQTDPFSLYGQGRPWLAYSWLFELLLYWLYRLFDLAGPIIYNVTMWGAIALALLVYVRRLVPKPVNAVALAGLGLFTMPLAMPRPWLFTILFFIVVLGVLLRFRETRSPRPLLLLPPLFALWANLHIQFIYGLFVIALAASEPLLNRLTRHSTTIDFKAARPLFATLAACLLATLANPYHVKLYGVVYEYASQAAPFHVVSELQAPDFREPLGWLLLGATVAAVFALGWRREVRPLPVLLLLVGIFLAFRAQRDVWFLSVVAVTIIASGRMTFSPEKARRLSGAERAVLSAAVLVSLLLVALLRPVSNVELQQLVARNFPAAAARVIEERGYPGPLYNHFNWGGYLIWRLPSLPVAMDGRTNLHGEARLLRSVATWSGARDWATDPELSAARLVVGSPDEPLASLLRLDARFELVYEDEVAVVFTARSPAPLPNTELMK